MISPLLLVEPPLHDRVRELLGSDAAKAEKEHVSWPLELIEWRLRRMGHLRAYGGISRIELGLPDACGTCGTAIDYRQSFEGLAAFCPCVKDGMIAPLVSWFEIFGSDLGDLFAAWRVAVREITQDVTKAAAFAHKLYSMFADDEASGAVAWMRLKAVTENNPLDELNENPEAKRNALLALDRETRRELTRIAAKLTRPKISDPLRTNKHGVLYWDAIAAKELAAIGEKGVEIAKTLRERSQNRINQLALSGEMQKGADVQVWRLWDRECRFIGALSRCLWADRIRNLPQQVKLPGIQMSLAEPLIGSLRRKAVRKDNQIRSKTGDKLSLVNPRDKLQAGAIGRILKTAPTPAVPKAIIYLSNAAVAQARLNYIDLREQSPTVKIEGGLDRFAAEIGCHSSDARNALDFLHYSDWIGRKGNKLDGFLWSYHEQPEPNKKACLYINLNIGLFRSAGDFLMFLPQHIPPLYGGAQGHQPQLVLAIWVMFELMTQRLSYFRNGGWLEISNKRWHQLAADADLPKSTLPQVLDLWQAGDDSAPPFLVEGESSKWRLSEAHLEVHQKVLQAGELTQKRSESGRKGLAKRYRKSRKGRSE